MLLRAALRALMWTVAALVLGGLSLATLTSPGVAGMAAPLVCASGETLVPAPSTGAVADGAAEPPAYLCASPTEVRPVTMTALIVAVAKPMALVIVLVFWPLLTRWRYVRARRRRHFVAEAVPATALIVAVRRTMFADRSQPVMEFALEIARAGVAPLSVKHRQALPDAFHAALQPGLEIPALVDRAEPHRFTVLFEHVPLTDPRDPAIPGTVDPARALDLLQDTWLMTADEAAARRARLASQG